MNTEDKENINKNQDLEVSENSTDKVDLPDSDGITPSAQETDDTGSVENTEDLHNLQHLSGMYKNWFLDYASYVILERAVPHIYDGLKPVQRRILHAMKKNDDGRYCKVASIIGHTMQYHPHGDASIGDALVQIGQKDLLIDTQGNWGNILTGDNAAAPRYIEARLSKFAHDVVFHSKTTYWKLSYDGRNKEPVALPVKFPLLLTQGSEGIAVGLSSKILPHNFNELIDASVNYLMDKKSEIYPDFPTGGLADFSRYNDGMRGGRVRIRAKITELDKKTLVITEIPYKVTTNSLIESITLANDKGKIKIKKIDDNTSENVEIIIHLAPGISPDETIDALYVFTDCEISVSPNCCIIEDDKPKFTSVSQVLEISAQNSVNLLKKELEINKSELQDAWHFASLEKIFIENKIYNDIEDCETWDSIIDTITKGLEPFKHLLKKDIVHDDIVRLTEIKIKRISKYDSIKADEHTKSIEAEIKQINYNLNNIIPYTIDYYKQIKKKYGNGRERKTEIRNFDTIEAAKVVVANKKLYVSRKEGFIGTAMKKDEFVCECSDIDDIIVFRNDGSYLITKVSDKLYIGKNIIHLSVFKKNDERTIYNVIYSDGKQGKVLMKRFAVKGIKRDKEYNLTKGADGSKVLYFSVNPDGEAEIVNVHLTPKPRLKNLVIKLDFSKLVIKQRTSSGNILTKHKVEKVVLKKKGESTLGGQNIWFDEEILRLNTSEKGKYLGEFSDNDKILIITKSGFFRLSTYELSNHFEEDILIIEKFTDTEKVYSAVFFDAKQKYYYAKRFLVEPNDKKAGFIGEHPDSKLLILSDENHPRVEIKFGGKNKKRAKETIELTEFIGIKSYKAHGKRLTTYKVSNVTQIEPIVAQTSEAKMSVANATDNSDINNNEVNDDEITTEKVIDNKATDDEATTEKVIDNKATNDEATTEKVIDNKATDDEATDEKVIDNKATDDEAHKQGNDLQMTLDI